MRGRKEIDRLGNAVGSLIPIPQNHDLANSLRKAGIEIRYFVDEKYDAFLQWDYKNDCPMIAVNAEHSYTRQNFSMAHELGHLLLNYNWIPYAPNENVATNKVLNVKYRGGTYSRQEQQDESIVNEFAASFLIPNNKLNRVVQQAEKSGKNFLDIVHIISSEFKASPATAKIRLSNFLEYNN